MAADLLVFDTALLVDDQDRRRYHSNVGLLTPYRPWFTGRTALDFGCSWGTSAIILRQLGAPEVVGVEPDLARVQRGHRLLRDIGMPGIRMHHVPDTRRLPFPDATFDFILANAVFEHIPQPRAVHLREVWRVLAPDGHLLINETPNWYFPKDVHTTKLWFNNWLPPRVAYRRAVRSGRYGKPFHEWTGSGWRGLGYHELRVLRPFTLVPETSRRRHRVLAALGVPASLLDPFPTWLLRKPSGSPRARRPATSA